MDLKIEFRCPPNITSFSQCEFPDNVTHVYCAYNHIKSFQYLPGSVRWIYCRNNQITSFQYLPNNVSEIRCDNNQITSFQYLPNKVSDIHCSNNKIKSFQYLPGSVTYISCGNNQITSFQYLPESVRIIDCQNNQIKSFQYLPGSVRANNCYDNPCHDELILKGLHKIHQENIDIIISNWISGISKLQYMRLNYLIHSLWKKYWYDQRDIQGYSRACRHLASKNCPNGFLNMTN